MKSTLKVGVLTSLLLAPVAIANAQETEAQSQITPITEQTSPINTVATTDAKERIIAQFGKLSVQSTADDMVIAKGDLAVLDKAGFNKGEIAFITAKYDYIVEQRRLLIELKKIGTSINALSYSSKTFSIDVAEVDSTYTKFLGRESAGDSSYLAVQGKYNKAVDAALKNEASTIAPTIRGTSLQFGYNDAERNNYFKTNGADIAKLNKMTKDAQATVTTVNELNKLVGLLAGPTPDFVAIKAATDEVTKAYNALSVDQKKIVAAYNPNNDVVTPYKEYTDTLTNLTAVDKVSKLIDTLKPGTNTFESQTIAAQAAFDRLGEAEQKLVQNKEQLSLYFNYVDLSRKVNALKPTGADYSAQITILIEEVKALKAVGDPNQVALDAIKEGLSKKLADLSEVEKKLATVIANINDLSNSQNLVEDMLAVRASYDALDAAAKKRVTNIKVLTDFEKSQKSMLNVIALIEKLDYTNKDYIKKAKSANSAYLKLDEAKRTFVKNYKDLSDKVAAMSVIAQIDALKITKKTYKDDVLAAENAYAALKDQRLVTNYSALQAARGYITEAKAFDDRIDALANEPVETFVEKVAALTAEYKIMDKNAKKLVEKEKTLSSYEKSNKDVVKVINLIAALNPNSKDYTKKVLAARKAYNALDEVSQKRVTNYASLTAVEDVASLIGLIASLKPTSKTFLKDLETARANYDALPADKKEAIINYELLVKAESELTSAHTVIALIDAALPGEEDYLTKLMNARIAYDKLSSGQKKLVSNIKDLTSREREVKPILNVMVQIENLDPEQKNFVSKVNSARKAYDKLTKDQKKYVNNIAILQNYEPVSTVIELIGKLKSSSKTFHADTIRARALYDALTADAKQYVSNYHLLQAAETSILGAANVSQMINDLPSVDPKQYIKRIEEIRAAYNALPSDQKKAVENYKTLQEQERLLKPVMSVVEDIDRLMTSKDIESQYQKILKAYDKLTATQRRYVYNEQIVLSLDSVIKVVKSINELKPSDKMYFGMIELARREYNSLSSTDKQKVANYSILLEAEKNMSDVKKVVALIAGLSTTSSTYVQDVANATAAYKALNSKIRGQVLNEDVLKKAEKDVAAVLKVVDAIAVIDPEDRNFEKKVLAAQKLYSGLTIEQQGLVYNYRVLQEYLDMQY